MGAIIFFLVAIILVVLVSIWAVKQAGKNKKVKNGFLNLQKNDERFLNSKLFDFINTSFILISESGFIALKSLYMKEIKILNIKDIVGFEIITNGKTTANAGGAVVGGLLFGGIGAVIGGIPKKEKITKMDFLFKVNDFNNPVIEIPIIALSVKKGSFEHQAIEEKIKSVMTTLEVVEKKNKGI